MNPPLSIDSRRPRPASDRRRRALSCFRPGCEGLEDRTVMSTTVHHPVMLAHASLVQHRPAVHASHVHVQPDLLASTGQAHAAGAHHRAMLRHAGVNHRGAQLQMVAPAAQAVPVAVPTTTTQVQATPGSSLADPTLVTLNLNPIDINLLGLELTTSQITVTVSAQPGSGQLLGNLLTTVSNLVNLQAVNNALNNVLGSVVNLLNTSTLSVSNAIAQTGPLTNATTGTTPVLNLFVAPVNLNLLGAVVQTSPITVSLVAHSGQGAGFLLGNVVSGLAHLLDNGPSTLNLDFIAAQLQKLNNQLSAAIPSIAGVVAPPVTIPAGSQQVLSLVVPPINLNLLGLLLQTSQIQVNANAYSGSGNLLGNLLNEILTSAGATPQNLSAVNNQLNTLLAKVITVLNASSLTLSANAVQSLTQVLQTLALPNLVNTSGTPATQQILNLNIASTNGTTPPVDVNLLGVEVTTSNIQAQLFAQTGDGQILGNLVYNVAHLLDPGGNLNLLSILGQLGL